MKPAHSEYYLEFFYTSFPERHRAEWFQWEFLRRNPDYRADYRRFQDAHGAWLRKNGYWYDFNSRPHWTSRQEKCFYKTIAPDIVRLCVKWDIGDLHPPHWQFTKAESRKTFREERPSRAATGHSAELNWNYSLVEELRQMGFTGSGGNARRYGHLFLVEFDLKWPMKDLVDFAKRVLVRAQKNYIESLKEQGYAYPTGRRRFQEYAFHLRVWDLSKKQGKTSAEVAAIVFPKYSKEVGQRMVRDHLKAAEKLISGKYKEIR